ncbi:hypothetical protein [Phragmitibacter flavus]|uniref:hypothetical protein n=1 Tax=Phragmitibacter flavus TaxID=2576071 RepID=UPI0014076AEF|nr:hypothetical protein [Phragmitibacter flavus]
MPLSQLAPPNQLPGATLVPPPLETPLAVAGVKSQNKVAAPSGVCIAAMVNKHPPHKKMDLVVFWKRGIGTSGYSIEDEILEITGTRVSFESREVRLKEFRGRMFDRQLRLQKNQIFLYCEIQFVPSLVT